MASENSRYTKGELKGSGSFKAVYTAYDAQEGREVALNEVSLLGLQQQKRERIFREVQMLKSLHHKRVLPIYDAWVTDSHLRFTTEMMSCNLNDFIKRAKRIKMKNVKKWSKQILNGLIYLHSKKVIHRDLKCENIFIDSSNSSIKIGDFGLSISVQDQKFAVSLIGTPNFLAPETLEEAYDEKVDIWSFGMCVLEMLTGEYPFAEHKSPLHVIRAIMDKKRPHAFQLIKDPLCRDFIETCLNEEASKRPSAADLLQHKFFEQNEDHDNIVIIYPDDPNQVTPIADHPPPEKPHISASERIPNAGVKITKTRLASHLSPKQKPSTASKRTTKRHHRRRKYSSSNRATVVVEATKEDMAILAIFIKIQGQYKKVKVNFSLESDTADQVANELKDYFNLERKQKNNIQQAIYDALAEINDDESPQPLERRGDMFRKGPLDGFTQNRNQEDRNGDLHRRSYSEEYLDNKEKPNNTNDTPHSFSKSRRVEVSAEELPISEISESEHPAYARRSSVSSVPHYFSPGEANIPSSSRTSPVLALHTSDQEYAHSVHSVYDRDRMSQTSSPSSSTRTRHTYTPPNYAHSNFNNNQKSSRRMSKREYLDRMNDLEERHQRELDELQEKIQILKQQKRELKGRFSSDRTKLLNEFKNSGDSDDEESSVISSGYYMPQSSSVPNTMYNSGLHEFHEPYHSSSSSPPSQKTTPKKRFSNRNMNHSHPHEVKIHSFDSQNDLNSFLGSPSHHQSSNESHYEGEPQSNHQVKQTDNSSTVENNTSSTYTDPGSQLPPVTVKHITPGTPLDVDYSAPFNSSFVPPSREADLLENDFLQLDSSASKTDQQTNSQNPDHDILSDLFDKSMQDMISEQPLLQPTKLSQRQSSRNSVS